MSVTTEILDRLGKAIQASGDRITEINNRAQKAAVNGTVRLGATQRTYVAKQVRKLERERAVNAVLHLARAEIVRLAGTQGYTDEQACGFVMVPPVGFSHVSDSGL